jgi:hypothetical protein
MPEHTLNLKVKCKRSPHIINLAPLRENIGGNGSIHIPESFLTSLLGGRECSYLRFSHFSRSERTSGADWMWQRPTERQESSRGLVTWQPRSEATMDWLPSYRTVQSQQWKALLFGQP